MGLSFLPINLDLVVTMRMVLFILILHYTAAFYCTWLKRKSYYYYFYFLNKNIIMAHYVVCFDN